MTSLRDAMDRLFEDAFIRPGWFAPAWGAAEMLPVDVYESGDQVVVKATVPGVKPEDVKISLENTVLTIRGERRQVAEEKADRVHRYERHYGVFERSFTVPSTVDAEHIRASYDLGVLTVRLPKTEKAKPRQIEGKVESSK